MRKKFTYGKIIESIIDEINNAKKTSEKIHSSGNIKSSGDEVEEIIREKISLFLPERYMVKQGHIINSEGKVSNQLDIIIFDRLNTPKFFETKNKTVYYPIESVLAIGEIKKTLRKNDVIEFGKKIKYIKKDMKRKLIENTVYGGKIKDHTQFSDMVNMRTDRKYKNPLFAFLFAIDVEKIDDLMIDDSYKYQPNAIYILNYGSFIYGEIKDKKLIYKVEDENPIMDEWLEIRKSGINCLGAMLEQIINHLNNSRIESFSISHYMVNQEEFIIKGKDVSFYKMKDNN